jgi:uncharacterized protein YuzE
MPEPRDTDKRSAYYDREADIVWIPTGESDDVVNEEMEWGLLDHDARSQEVVGVELWRASTHFPADLLMNLPDPPRPND